MLVSGDLPVLTFGDCVMWINDRADQVVFETTHVRFLTFLQYFFFKIQKAMTFYVFWVAARVFSNTMGL